jgi:hypothetical protein
MNKLKIKRVFHWFTRTRRRKVLSSILVILMVLTSIRFVFFTPKPSEVKADSLLKFDEGYGTTINDSEGSASGTITGASWQTEDLCFDEMCLYFDGSDWISFGDEDSFDFAAATDFTIEFWFRYVATGSTQVIIQKYDSGPSDGGYRIQVGGGGKLSFGVDDANGGFADDEITSTSFLDDDHWYHVAAVKDGTTGIYLYIDTVLEASDTSIGSTGTLANDDTFYIGDSNGSDDGDELIGYVDEVKVYTSTARTADEVKADYLAHSPERGTAAKFGPDQSYLSDGLRAYYNFDETTLNSCGTNTDACDSASKVTNRNLSAINQATTVSTPGKFGNAATFDGTTDYYCNDTDDDAACEDFNGLDIGDNLDFTFAFWFYRDTFTTDDVLIAKSADIGNVNGYAIYVPSGSDQVTLNLRDQVGSDTCTFSSATAFTTSAWNHVVVVFDDKDLLNSRIYVNGVDDTGSRSCTQTQHDNLDAFIHKLNMTTLMHLTTAKLLLLEQKATVDFHTKEILTKFVIITIGHSRQLKLQIYTNGLQDLWFTGNSMKIVEPQLYMIVREMEETELCRAISQSLIG